MYTIKIITLNDDCVITADTRDDAYIIGDVAAKYALTTGEDVIIIITDGYHAEVTNISGGTVGAQYSMHAA
jgi:hypothetical protein